MSNIIGLVNKMNILISNDDGVDSAGMTALAEKLSKLNNVLVVAPDGNRSASSHSLTLSGKVRLKKISKETRFDKYSLSGTPADCVKFAELVFNDFKTDIVVSGINKGHNIGSDILYSGTVSVACEASFFGHTSFAFSAFSYNESDLSGYSDYAAKIIDTLLPMSMQGDIWNVNFPDVSPSKIKGVKVTGLGKQIYSDRYVKVSDNEYILVGSPLHNIENDEDCDVEWIKKGYVTVTPVLFNKTNYERITEVKEKCEKLL